LRFLAFALLAIWKIGIPIAPKMGKPVALG